MFRKFNPVLFLIVVLSFLFRAATSAMVATTAESHDFIEGGVVINPKKPGEWGILKELYEDFAIVILDGIEQRVNRGWIRPASELETAIYWLVNNRRESQTLNQAYKDYLAANPDLADLLARKTSASSASKDSEESARATALHILNYRLEMLKESGLTGGALLKAFKDSPEYEALSRYFSSKNIELERYEWRFNTVQTVKYCMNLVNRLPGILVVSDGLTLKLNADFLYPMLDGLKDSAANGDEKAINHLAKMQAVKVHAPRVKLPSDLSYSDFS